MKTKIWKTIACDSCDVLVINNVICHEHGCPDAWKDSIRECSWCGAKFKPESREQSFCDETCAESYYS